MTDPTLPNKVDNVGIENPDTRRRLTTWFSIILLIATAVQLFFGFFPEAALGTDYPARIVNFVTALVTLVTGYYGLTVVKPNIPKF